MNCEICNKRWDSKVHIPLLLPCGHTFCEECLKKKVSSLVKTPLKCPNCNKSHPSITSENSLKKLTKNKSLLEINEKMEHRYSLLTQSLTLQDNKSDLDLIKSSDLHKLDNFYYPLCETHKNKALYYVNNSKGQQEYFCEICVETLRIKNYSPLPYLKEQNESQIESALLKIDLLKKEIERTEAFITNYMKTFEIQNTNKIDELFDYINKVIQYNYTTAKTLLTQCKNEQQNQIEKKLEELKTLKKDLYKYEKKLQDLKGKDMLTLREQIINNTLFNKVGNFINYDNEISLFQMKIEVKEDIKENIFELIQNSFDIDVNFYKNKNGENITLKEVLQKEANWQCECGFFENEEADLICKQCKKYRKLETFENLIFNPLNVSKKELNFLNQRRKSEIKYFQSAMANNKDKNKFYCIDTNWFLQWKCFVTNDFTEKYIKNTKKRFSDNSMIGVLPPSYITNFKICGKNTKIPTGISKGSNTSDTYVLKSDLKYKENFLIINKSIWDFFFLNYGGGPEIKIDDKAKERFEKGIRLDDNNCSESYVDNNSDIVESPSNADHDPNGTLLNDTTNRIQSISNYNFEVRLGGFEQHEDNNDDNASLKKLNAMFDNIYIKDENNV